GSSSGSWRTTPTARARPCRSTSTTSRRSGSAFTGRRLAQLPRISAERSGDTRPWGTIERDLYGGMMACHAVEATRGQAYRRARVGERRSVRVLTYLDGDGPRVGVRTDGGVAPTSYADLRALIAEGDAGGERLLEER